MASITITRNVNSGARIWYASFFLTLTTNEMTQSRWHEFNDMEHHVKQIATSMSWKDCLVEYVTLFHFMLICLCINIYELIVGF